MPALASSGDAVVVDVLEVIGRARADLGAELRAADIGELTDMEANAEPGAPRGLADEARLVDGEGVLVDVGVDELRELVLRDLLHERRCRARRT